MLRLIPRSLLRNKFSVLALAVILGGCSLAPDYRRPEAPIGASYPVGGPAADMVPAAGAQPPVDISWREFFGDPLLQELIAQALTTNRDLRKAMLGAEAARAQYRIQRAELLPHLAMETSGAGQRLPADLNQTGTSEIYRRYQWGAAISWELDLWGRVRSLKDQALATYLALEETRAAAELALIAEVANTYLALSADRELLGLSQQTLISRQRALDLTRRLVEAGTANQLDLSRAEMAVRTAEASLALYSRNVEQDLSALVLLLGRPLEPAMARQLDHPSVLSNELLPADLPLGAPSELLVRRPDIRAAEQQLRAANANIGAARAAFLPGISLTGAAGGASTNMEALFDKESYAWQFIPRVRLPIFSGGALKSGLDVATLRKQIEIAHYEKVIQTAFKEVVDGLAAKQMLDQQIQSQEQLVAASKSAYELAGQRFNEGLDDNLSLLAAQRTLFDAQQTLVNIRLARATNTINLYKALGGGWLEQKPLASSSPFHGLKNS